MTRSLSTLMLALALAACAQPPAPTEPATTAEAAPPPEGANAMNPALGRYHWRLQDATDAQGRRIEALLVRPEQPLQFDFADGRIRVANACNGIGGEVRIDSDTLRFGPLVSTRMACADAAVMALDSEVAKRLQGGVRFELPESDPAQLVLTAGDGDVLRFVGAPTPETRFGNPGTTVFMEVAAHSKPCQKPMMPALQSCLEVRELHFAEGQPVGEPGAWQLFRDNIEGYTHEDGIRTVLRIKRFAIANPPMDTPAIGYVLEMVVESETVGP